LTQKLGGIKPSLKNKSIECSRNLRQRSAASKRFGVGWPRFAPKRTFSTFSAISPNVRPAASFCSPHRSYRAAEEVPLIRLRCPLPFRPPAHRFEWLVGRAQGQHLFFWQCSWPKELKLVQMGDENLAPDRRESAVNIFACWLKRRLCANKASRTASSRSLIDEMTDSPRTLFL